MLPLSANLSLLYPELPLEEAVGAAVRAGYRAVEIQYPYAVAAPRLAACCEHHGVRLLLINAPLGDEPQRKGLACDPADQPAFQARVQEGLAYAQATGCRLLHVLSGRTAAAVPRALAEQTWRANMQWAAEQGARHDVTVVVEALNQQDTPDYFLRATAEAAQLVRLVDHPRLRLLFDAYHCERDGQDCAQVYAACRDVVAHVQVADVPGRGAPGSGRVAWRAFFQALADGGYAGHVGCEYHPGSATAERRPAWRDDRANEISTKING